MKLLRTRAWKEIFSGWLNQKTKPQTVDEKISLLKAEAPEAFKQAAINYPGKLPVDLRYYLYTKPFDRSKNKTYSALFFHHFASMLEILSLPQRARILDVACGPGWLSEFLARSGYDVTGIDICPDMIRIANERVQSIRFGPHEHQPMKIRFLIGDIESAKLDNAAYHAVIFYDSLHHFCDPQATLEAVFHVLKPGGKLYIQEGIKPPPDSEAEKELHKEMRSYGTLEKPFSQKELLDLLTNAGYVAVQAFEPVHFILKRAGSAIIPKTRDLPIPVTNTIMARKPGNSLESDAPGLLKAHLSIEGAGPPQTAFAGAMVELRIELRNIGDTLWLSESRPDGGYVRLGTKWLDENRSQLTDALERTALPHDVPPGQEAIVCHRFALPKEPGRYRIKLDLVDEQVSWFEQEGSTALEFPIHIQAQN